jgi:nucleotide-binding universal stress UspA family protein
MYRRILVSLDGSKVAEQVLPYVRYLAKRLKIPVDLLAVVDVVGMTGSIAASQARNLDAFVGENVQHCEAYLEKIGKTLAGIATSSIVMKGKPEEVVIDKATDHLDTLIAMATHGRSGVDRWLLGSVAEKVLRFTTNPLLLVRASKDGKSEGEKFIKRVIVPLDGSALAEKVLPHVTALAKEIPFETVLLRAYNLRQVISTFEDYVPDWDLLEAEAMGEAMSYLDGKARELKGQGLVEVSTRASEKEPAQEIVDLAAEPDSLIAMCTHGRSGLRRWVLGSVAEKVVRHSNSPVLVIPARGNSALPGEKRAEPIDEMRDALKYSLD